MLDFIGLTYEGKMVEKLSQIEEDQQIDIIVQQHEGYQTPVVAEALTTEEQVLEAWEVMQLVKSIKNLERVTRKKMSRIATSVMADVATSYQAGNTAEPQSKSELDEVSILSLEFSRGEYHTAFDGLKFEEELLRARHSLAAAFPNEPLLSKLKELWNSGLADNLEID